MANKIIWTNKRILTNKRIRQVHFLHDGDLLIQASSVSRSAFGIRVRAVQTLLGMDSLIATSLEELCMKMGCTQLYAFANATLQQYQVRASFKKDNISSLFLS